MFVPLIFFVFAGLVVAVIVVNTAPTRFASTRTGSSLIGVSSFASGLAAAVFALSIVTPRSSLADGKPLDKDAGKTTPDAAEATPKSSSILPEAPPSASDSSADSAPLNSPPLATIQIDREKRPSWVESAAVQFGDVHTIAVKGGPYPSQRECLRALDIELKKATDEYIGEYLGSPQSPVLLNYDVRFIKEHLVRDKIYDEMLLSPLVGEMRQTHALVQFDTNFRRELDDRWGQVKAAGRLGQVGLGVGGVLALLGTFLGYLRMDTATRGYYTGRLQFAAATTILAIVATGVVVAKLIPWH